MFHLRGLRAVADWRSIAAAPHLSPGELEALQWQRLGKLVRHAYSRSPHYRRLFRSAGIRPRDIRSREDFACLPVTTRADLREPDALIADGFNSARLKRSTTSGSSGEPTTTYFDARAWFLSKYLLKLRARRACGVRASDRLALFQEGVGEQHPRPFARMHAFTIHRPVQTIVDDVVRFAPTVLYGFPGYLLRLGAAADGRLRPRRVFTSSELLDAQGRQRLEALYGAPVLDVYGSTEVKEIAWQCPLAGAYHLNADWLVLETIPEREGIGRIVVTPLFNYAMPLLRYELGDTGELVQGRCKCGLGRPLARPVHGRDVDYFRLPGGEEITPYDLTCAIERIPGMRRYRLTARVRYPGRSSSTSRMRSCPRKFRPSLVSFSCERIVCMCRRRPSVPSRQPQSRSTHSA